MTERKSAEEILVTAYSPRYAAAARDLLQIEGGFVDDPADRGGATKYGWSLRTLVAEGAIDRDGDGKADFDLDFDGDIDGRDVRLLTLGDAIYLYHECFWKRMDCDRFPQPLGEMLFDQGVNGGISAAKKLLQQALNACLTKGGGSRPVSLKIDGGLGQQTNAALAYVLQYPGLGMPALVEAFRDAVRARYRAIVAANPSQQKFLRGWLARAERLGR